MRLAITPFLGGKRLSIRGPSFSWGVMLIPYGAVAEVAVTFVNVLVMRWSRHHLPPTYQLPFFKDACLAAEAVCIVVVGIGFVYCIRVKTFFRFNYLARGLCAMTGAVYGITGLVWLFARLPGGVGLDSLSLLYPLSLSCVATTILAVFVANVTGRWRRWWLAWLSGLGAIFFTLLSHFDSASGVGALFLFPIWCFVFASELKARRALGLLPEVF